MAIVLPQAIAPAFVTSTYAFSISSNILNGNLIWIILLVISASFLLGPPLSYLSVTDYNTAGFATVHCLTLKEPEHDWRKTDGFQCEQECP